MRAMSLRTSHDDVLDATEHLPVGATLVIHEFEWDDYEHLLEALGDRPGLRVSYDCGRLEILSPSSPHEQYARLMDLIVFVFCEIFDLNLRCFGGATWRKRALARGLEADSCYYVKSAELIRGKNDINLESDPPPDIAVEIDLTKSSLRKFPIYAALSILSPKQRPCPVQRDVLEVAPTFRLGFADCSGGLRNLAERGFDFIDRKMMPSSI